MDTIEVTVITATETRIENMDPGVAAAGCDSAIKWGVSTKCALRNNLVLGWEPCVPRRNCGARKTDIPSPTMRRRFGDLLDE